MTEAGEIITGYKATDENMECRGFKFEIGKWYEHEGEIELCESGFHFCEYPSGPWSYYVEGRLFKCEAEFVKISNSPGAGLKHVAKRIRLIEEIKIYGDGNTGDRNTGDGNTGNRNTGDRNTGDRNTGNGNAGGRNTGYWNTGDRNTGDRNTGNGNTGNGNTGYWNTGNGNTGGRNTGYGNTGYENTGDRNTGNGNTGDGNTGNGNTGYWNTGDRNTGDRNTGYGNTGDGNTGDRNTGNGNTGDRNTGDRNTGYGNCCDYSSGYFNIEDQPIYIFGEIFEGKREDLDHESIHHLAQLLSNDEVFDYEDFTGIPNSTPEKVKTLHEKHIAKRKEFSSRGA